MQTTANTSAKGAPRLPTRNEFRDYLKDFGFQDVVGNAKESDDCPLTRMLKQYYNGNFPEVRVGTGAITLRSKKDNFVLQTPMWIDNFIEMLDALGKEEVTASVALGLLKHS